VRGAFVSRREPTPENGEALVRVLDALDVTRKAYRACRHDQEALEHVHRAG
jgi:hypothetical protein